MTLHSAKAHSEGRDLMQNSVSMEHMDAFTYRHLVSKGTVGFVPVGSLEQHGAHMPMSVDRLLAQHMALETAEIVGGVVAAPLSYGYKSQQHTGGGYPHAGTISLDGNTLSSMVRDITRDLAEDGIRKIVFMNGHFENYQFLYEGVELALRDLHMEGIDGTRAMLMSYWDFIGNDVVSQIYPEGFSGWAFEHGGVLETSLMLLWEPELVHMERVTPELYVGLPAVQPNYDVLPIVAHYTPPSGCLSHPGNATREKGEIVRDACIRNMVSAIRNEFGIA